MADFPVIEDFIEFTPLWPDQTEEVILERMRGWANEGLDPATAAPGAWTDTREGSHWFTGAMPAAREIARLYDLAGTEAVMAGMVLWAWGAYLDDHAQVQDLVRLAATPAQGVVVFTGPEGTPLSAGTQVGVDPAAPDDPAPLYQTLLDGTIPGPADPPATVDAVPSATGGTLGPGARNYVVTAIDAAGETLASVEASATVPSGGAGSVALDWDAVATATGYRIYEGASGGPYSFMAELPATEVTWLDGGSVVADGTRHPPVANTTGGALARAVIAVEAGSEGNVGAGAITAPSTPLPADVTFTNPAAAIGGTDPETDEALRRRLMDVFAAGGLANDVFYKKLAEEHDGVGHATVIALWNGPNTILIVLVAPDGQPVPDSVVDEVQADIDPIAGKGAGSGEVGAIVTVRTATALPIAVEATVEFEFGYSLDGADGTTALRASIVRAVDAYVASVTSGGEVVLTQVEGRIVTIPGVHDVSDVTLNGTAANVAVAAGTTPEVPVLDPAPVLTEA